MKIVANEISSAKAHRAAVTSGVTEQGADGDKQHW